MSKEKKKSKKGWLVAAAIVLGLGAIGNAIDGDEAEKQQVEVPQNEIRQEVEETPETPAYVIPDEAELAQSELPEDTAPSTDEHEEPQEVASVASPADIEPLETTDAAIAVPIGSTFEVHFIDVGQADSALVMCDGKAMLIDGGNTDDSSLIYTYLQNQEVTHLDYIVASHAHEDHVGGLAGALNYATVGTVYCPVTSYDSEAFGDFTKYVGESGASITVPSPGDTFNLGSASVEIVGVDPSASAENDTSIVLRIVYGETSFLFTGDAERYAETKVINNHYELESTVLKVAHHGSADGTTYPFLRRIMPEYAVISVGEGNSYMHPAEATLSRLYDADVKVLRTDLQGDIVFTSDGHTVSYEVEKNPFANTYKAPGPVVTEQKPTPAPAPTPAPETEQQITAGTDYVGNKNSYKFHYAWCSSVDKMKESNKYYYTGTRDEMIGKGYDPCKNCNP